MSFLSDMSKQLGLSTAPAAESEGAPTQEGGAAAKVHLCGRDRKVIVEGRYRYVMVKGEKVSITKAREMDKKFKADKKAKEAKMAAKKGKKGGK